MTLFAVSRWGKLFENNRTREMKEMKWVPIPNSHDGDGYTQIMEDSKHGSETLAAWLLIVQVASKCEPRGTLLRKDGTPHDSKSMARVTRAPARIFDRALPILLRIKWLESIAHEGAEIPQDPAQKEGREGKEKKGIEKCAHGELGKVLLTEKEYTKLLSKHGKPFLQQAIEVLDTYIASKGIKYDSCYAVFKADSWIWEKLSKGQGSTSAPAEETDPAILDYGKQLRRMRATGGILDADARKLYRKIKDACGPGAVERVKKAAARGK